MSDAKPGEKPSMSAKTQELPAMTDRALLEDLSRVVRTSFKEVNIRLEDVVNESIRTNTRLTRLEQHAEDVDQRMGKHSHRVREASSNDLAQEAKHAQLAAELAEEKKAREALAATVAAQPTKADMDLAIKNQNSFLAPMLKDAAKTPIGAKVIGAFGVAALALLVYVAAHLEKKTAELHTPPPPSIVYVMPVDGGAK